MTPHFHDEAAARRWTAYLAEVDRALRHVGPEARGLRDDLAAHLAESFAAGDPAMPEPARLDAAIARLGRPADYLRPLVADALLEKGTRRFRPAALIHGLYHGAWLGSARALVALAFGLGYLLLALFAAMALLKPLWGEHIGLFRSRAGAISFGFLSDTAGARELLGLWIVPIALGVAALLYVALTWGLRTLWRRL